MSMYGRLKAMNGDAVIILILLVLAGMAVIKIWERNKTAGSLRTAVVLLDWRPSGDVWRKALGSRSGHWFSIVLGYILAVLALSFALGLNLIEEGSLTGGSLSRFNIRAAALLLCAALLWWRFRPVKWRFPCRYVLTEKGIWVIGDGGRSYTGFMKWGDFDQVVQLGENLIELNTPGRSQSVDIVYPQELKEKVGAVIREKVPIVWSKAA